MEARHEADNDGSTAGADAKDEQLFATETEYKNASDGDEPVVVSAFAELSRGAAIRKFWRLFTIGLCVSISGMYIGYAQTVGGSIVANEGFIRQFATVTDPETGARVLDANHVSLWGAVTFASQIVVQLFSGHIADRWGRKINMWLLQGVLTASIVTAIVSKDWRVFTVARILSGFAGGFIGTTIMVYMSEIALPQFRGTLLSSFALAMTLGQIFLAIGLKVLNDTNPLAFRNIFYAELVFFELWMITVLLLPESPAWYAAKGRHEKGKVALRRLIGNVEGYEIDREYRVLLKEVEESRRQTEAQAKTSWAAMLKRPNLRRTIISALPLVFQSFSGIALVFGFSTYFFALARVPDPFLGSLILQTVVFAGNLTSFYFIDKFGRRILVIGGGAVLAAASYSMGGMGWLDPSKQSSGIALVAVCCFWAFIYANTLGPIGWISIVEMSTPNLRAKTASIATVFQSCILVLFSYTVPLMLSNQGLGWGAKIGVFYGSFTVLFLFILFFVFPEAKDRTYGELDELFERGIPAWRFASTKTAHQSQLESHA